MPYTYEYPRPAVTTDCVVFGLDDGDLRVLLIQRRDKPFAGRWALPGGFVHMEENLDAAARRELKEETGLSCDYLEQLYSFGEPGRDPRGRTITVAYYALVRRTEHQIRGGSDAKEAAWFSLHDLPRLAFDHDTILATAHKRLQAKVRYQPIGFNLLPVKFTLTELQRMYEAILDRTLDKRNFRKKILSMGVLDDLKESQRGVAHRAARLYSFSKTGYATMLERGFNFEV
jgi:8-oxo-dGTP diphosphatase